MSSNEYNEGRIIKGAFYKIKNVLLDQTGLTAKTGPNNGYILILKYKKFVENSNNDDIIENTGVITSSNVDITLYSSICYGISYSRMIEIKPLPFEGDYYDTTIRLLGEEIAAFSTTVYNRFIYSTAGILNPTLKTPAYFDNTGKL